MTAPPGGVLHGLSIVLDSVYEWQEQRREKSKKSSNNLLDYLRPAGLEQRLVRSCRDLFGINKPRARLFLLAQEQLTRCAARHELILPGETAAAEKELVRLRGELDALG